MASSRQIKALFVLSFILWLSVMGNVYYSHYIRQAEEELGYFSSDVKFDNEQRQFFNIYLDGSKIGYKSEFQQAQTVLKVFRETSTLKMNLAGLSREVFIQTVTAVDTASKVTMYMDFTLSSGTHENNFNATVKNDSLIVFVKNSPIAELRGGAFIVDENITFPSALPYFISSSDAEILNIQVFDPIEFDFYPVHIGREGEETLQIADKSYAAVKYDLRFKKRNSTLWLDENGTVLKSEGFPLFGNIFGSLSIERSEDKSVFLLPLEVTYGKDLLKSRAYYPRNFIEAPRDMEYLEIEIKNLRAANIDISASNKEMLSVNPLIFGIHNRPFAGSKRILNELKAVAADTMIYGMSDYIQPYDARIIRKAREIAASEPDTLKIAQLLNRWVYTSMEKTEGLDIVRSVDILRNLRGNCDEHTKLFTALARSIGIPAQINMGLVYKDRAFRYHSWPSVFTDGVWHDLDPMFGQDYADATHISLVRGDYDKLVELLRIILTISVKVHKYR